MNAATLTRHRSVDLVPRERRLRRPGDLKRVGFGLLLLTLMVAVHARGEQPPTRYTESAYTGALGRFVDHEGLVDYHRLREDPFSRQAIQAAADGPRVDPPSLVDARLADLINRYNATVLMLLFERGAGGPESPEDVSELEGGKVFDTPRIEFHGEQISLNQLEKEHIAPLAGDARYHFAINCGALSCPPLRAEAYTGEKLQEQLDDQVARTLTTDDPRFLVWLGGGAVEATKLMDWYGEEFGDPAAYLNEHADLPGEVTEVTFLGYDWSLNAQD